MATKKCSKNFSEIPLDVTGGERLLLKVRNTAAGAAFVIREQMDGEPKGRTVLDFTESVSADYETLWPWPGQKKPASGRHSFTFVGTFFLSTLYTLQVFHLDSAGKKTLLKDCVYEREKNKDDDQKRDRFVVDVA